MQNSILGPRCNQQPQAPHSRFEVQTHTENLKKTQNKNIATPQYNIKAYRNYTHFLLVAFSSPCVVYVGQVNVFFTSEWTAIGLAAGFSPDPGKK